MSSNSSPVFISKNELKPFTNWTDILYALEQAFLSVSNTSKETGLPFCSQPARSLVQAGEGLLLCMPGFLGNHCILRDCPESSRVSTLACKLIASFGANLRLETPIPDINGNIFLFNENTGRLQATLEANYLTGLRTAAASIVATEQIFFSRTTNQSAFVLGIIGTGTQGEFHAIGFLNTHKFVQIRLWNRTKARSEHLRTKLLELKPNSINSNVHISVHDSVEECCKDCDVIVSATSSSTPLIFNRFLKSNVHINAIGAGRSHHAELSQDVYDDCNVFIDYWNGARSELATLKANIVGEIGEVMTKKKNVPSSGITVFQSIGMAVQDAAIGRLFYDKYQQNIG
ncbi:ketimine reductase mu-crystallin isoform X2 [Toxorhynchites rutilus septentrionalis]|uniref:ketimine reductase mu-crystallin isoform X2 n=1 Tax=Toxorhynchites rutilus septentrionalis TaxID=329112 RepID=UPI0024794AF7|nr:ketimine reductase mu-crystallin isoform X2 [Toxorhynchites rutilus septentrionalis]